MHTTTTIGTGHLSTITVRAAAVAVFALTACIGVQAQSLSANPAFSPLNLKMALATPLNLAYSGPDVSSADSSISSSVASDAAADERFNLSGGDATQPPPRRRYGRPRYNDRMHNADGSNKVAFSIGGGLTLPVSNSSNVFTPGYQLKGGIGYNFSQKLGVMAEVGYDHFGLKGPVIASQAAYYNSFSIPDPTTGNQTDFSQLDANAHVWSITIDPILTVHQGETLGAYIIGGGGFYHKAVNFTLPQTGYYCDPYYGYCYQITSNQNFDVHSANGGGLNGGVGLTFKLSRFSSAKLFTEARYVWSNAKLLNDQSSIATLDNSSNSYIPITFGIRW